LFFAIVVSVTSTNAASILFGRVGSASYVADGQDLIDYLVADGNTVDYVDLNATVITDFSAYSQVWVYDLVTGTNQSSNQLANYTNIANWYNNDAAQNLITDARVISSSDRWTDLPNGLGTGGEPEWIQNYANQLDAFGGGLVLGTDHNSYQSGINEINDLIGIDPFTGFYYTPPLEAYVDPLSPLFVPELETCSAAPGNYCINDNSSTGFVPTGMQSNGQYLTPVAYHGHISTAYENAAVSTTFGSPTFSVPEPSTLILVTAGLAGLGFAKRKKKQA
jgi:hypothetical protein